MEYSFYAYGHELIRCKHVKTIEFTKELELTERGDCIAGVRATFELAELKKFAKKVRMFMRVETLDGEQLVDEVKFKVSPHFSSNEELVVRKSGFSSDRTFGVGLNRGASRINREIVRLMQNPDTKMTVTIKSGWADS